MNTIRWGLLSTAHINHRVIPAIRASSRGKLVAVASRDLENARSYAARWKIPSFFGSYQSMLDSGLVDAVYISLPNHLHAEWSIRAMQAGVHVLCEKPFALTLEEVDRMIATSQESGHVLAEAFMYRHHPQTKIAGEWVRSGRLGEITQVWSVFNFMLTERDNVRLAPEYGGGCLWDVGVYPLSFAQYIYGGPPKSVFGMQQVGESGVDETFAGQMGYPGGGLAQITASFRTPFTIYAEVIGTQGRLILTRPFTSMEKGCHLTFHPTEGRAQEIPVPRQELYIGEIEDMQDAILAGKPPYLSLAETRNHVRTVLALYKSARSGMPVTLG
jgi:D-xylose 1-dehydrogenase (NADP+, D-xylono-1,5-lactone-forming)